MNALVSAAISGVLLAQVGLQDYGRPLPAAPNARVTLTLDRPESLLGDNVLVHYCLENTGGEPFVIEVGGDYRAASRSLRFKFTVTDERGVAMPDPDPERFGLGGVVSRPSVAPGQPWCASVPLFRYARVDTPGTFEIRVVHDLGWTAGTAPEGRTRVVLRMPTDAEAARIVAAALAPIEPRRMMSEPSPPAPDFTVMRHPPYLASLVAHAQAGELRVIAGIGNVATPEATRALIRLIDAADERVAAEARSWLAMRLPDPALAGKLPPRGPFNNQLTAQRRYLSSASWRPEFEADVRAAAVRLLTRDDVRSISAAGFMLQAVGRIEDTPALSATLSRAIERTPSLPTERGIYPRPRGAAAELMRTAEMLVARGYRTSDPQRSAGEIALWLVAFAQGDRPAGWERDMAWALEHSIPFVRELALDRLPDTLPAEFIPIVRGLLAHADADVQIAACRVVMRARLAVLHEPVLDVLRRATDIYVIRASANALSGSGGARFAGLEIVAARLPEPGMTSELLQLLTGVFETRGGSSDDAFVAGEAVRLSARWRAFLAARRAELESGRRVALDDSVPTDLVPFGWKFRRPDGTTWPPGR